jgi:hypothetical protein
MQAMPRSARQAAAMTAMGLAGSSEGELALPNRSLRRRKSEAVSEATAALLTLAPEDQ